MFESHRPDAEEVRDAEPKAERALDWLAGRSAVEETLHASLGGLPSERDERLARMADVLQATAQGLAPQAAAVWAGVPEPLVQQWLENDREFAHAVQAAAALGAAHGREPGGARTPAMVRVVLLALSQGASWGTAADTAGLSTYKLRQMWRASPTLVALVDAARRVRPPKATAFVPSSYRPRRPGRRPAGTGYRLVQRDDPE
ncbi:hypothetical protein [Streptomyces sp. NPDC048663]|uniref:hypothetical protein n=1 Tax=Streptomyces sp. NPDC048663 TaxID=3155638 RepID=UPI00341E9541